VCKEYKKYTDSVEFETADVCIRLFDFLGMKGIEPDTFEEMKDDWQNMFASLSVCEQCYEMLQGITLICNTTTPNEIAELAGAMILFCFDFAKEHGFDLEQHIVWKMKYNNLRAKLHGKSY
jgi:DNA modification methylase